MFFVLSKVLGFLALPSNLLVVLGFGGLALLWTRFARAGRALLLASLALLALFGLSPAGNMLILPLEDRFPPWRGAGEPDGIVVLGGGMSPSVTAARGEPALDEAAERLIAMVQLAQRYPRAKIVFTGGAADLIFDSGGTEAQVAARFFESFGLPRAHLIAEDRSRNTIENAEFSKRMAAPQPGERWLLVTSAYHMPRAIGVFRRAGFAVEAYPVDWRTRGPRSALDPFQSVADGLKRSDTAAREYVGLFVYWLTGRMSELWPGP
jgi:uncharacterized SAM-binding protein YcdF (DUF218 family)